MKYLVGIPCLYGAGHTKEAIESVVNKPGVDLLLIDNGAEQSVKDVLHSYSNRLNVKIINNPVNIYVNPAWNQILNHFLNNKYDYLLIMNSDLILHKDWKNILDAYLNEYPNNIPIPYISTNKADLNRNTDIHSSIEVVAGTPGVLICLNKAHANLVYPIPGTLKVWFGDNWIYDGLRGVGYKTIIVNNLITYHSGSQNVSKAKGISEIIEQDKIEWEKLK
jgi:hypothetical protein